MSDNIPIALSAAQAEHDPNYAISGPPGNARRSLNAFTPQRASAADHSEPSQKTQISQAAVRHLFQGLPLTAAKA